jgi:ATP-dependent protease ClpP protease subunit
VAASTSLDSSRPRHRDARSIWEANPWLAYAYADLQSFSENLRASRNFSMDNAFDALDQRAIADADRMQQAVLRRAAASRPISSAALQAGSIAMRQGGRLTLWVIGPIGLIAADLVAALQQHADAAGIVVRIDSSGGDVAGAFDVAHALLKHRARKLAIIDRACWSAAVLVAAACDRVSCRSNATVMIHPIHKVAVAGTAVDLSNAAFAVRADDAKYLRFIERQRSIPAAVLKELHPREHFMSAEEAVALGFADRISPALPSIEAAVVPADALSPIAPEEMNMFERGDFQKARAVMTRAEAELQRHLKNLAETEQSIAKAEGESADLDAREAVLFDRDDDMPTLQKALDGVEVARRQLRERIDQGRRLQAHRTAAVTQAKAALVDAERCVCAAQASHYAAAYQDALEAIWSAMRIPLRDLVVAAGADAYHEELAKVGSYPAMAVDTWNKVNISFLTEVVLSNLVTRKLLAERSAGDDSFFSAINIDAPPKGAPPVHAVRSALLTDDDRASTPASRLATASSAPAGDLQAA